MCDHVLLFGVGNVLRGDDGAGPALLSLLQRKNLPWLRCRDGGQNPENVLPQMATERAGKILVVDAALMGLPPGSVRQVPPDLLREEISLSGLSLGFLLGCYGRGRDLSLIGIEPLRRGLEKGLSLPVARAVASTARLIESRRWDEIARLTFTR
ncbi:hydrogenase maturation protease [Aminithiophilus ramosus]|uniref:Hydrogenase maturation protease n=2 Tax=Synergistales TaxID=649776 RepID=A0A9Q7EUB2_9BACT|nr:hydrogenase maturation protease [Aminithiophilus ramosus]QTX31583.1 hydrogenase maturation protease [Aminithiophilus ramosus]QVL35390.1 hydrogenase maturation protease [Synergistota bacterium]